MAAGRNALKRGVPLYEVSLRPRILAAVRIRRHVLGAAAGATLAFALAPTAVRAGSSTEVAVTATAQDSTEPSVAVNPTNAQNVVIAYMFHAKGIDTWLGVATSFDGGATWSTQYLPFTGTPATVATLNADTSVDGTFADPDVVFDSAGNAYVSGIAYNHTFEHGAVLVSRSSDGGRTWGTPNVAIQGTSDCGPSNCIDRPWLAVAPGGTLYLVAQTIFVNGEADLLSHEYLTSSSDGGTTWTAATAVDDASYRADTLPEGTITVTPGGVVAIAYNASAVPEGIPCPCLAVATTTDGGATFTYHTVTTATEANYGVNLGDQAEPEVDGQPDVYRFALAPTIVADPAVDGRLVIARLSFPGTVPYQIEKQGQIQATQFESDDTGATWSAPVVVQQSSATSSDRLWAAYDGAGHLGVVFRSHQGRCCNTAFEIWGASSGGDLSFASPSELSTADSPDSGAGQGLGDDFIGGAMSGSSLLAAWSDDRSGTKQIYFATTPLPAAPAAATSQAGPLLAGGAVGGVAPLAIRRRRKGSR